MDQNYLLNMVATGLTKMDWVGGSQNTAPDKSGDPMSDFQKMLDQKSQSTKPESKDQPKEETAPATKKEEAPVQEEDPVETVKRMQVYLVPVSPEELAQYPAEWLPQVEEGEPIVCVGVRTDENGQQVPILMGANEAYSKHGWKVATPEVMTQEPQGGTEAPQELAQAPAYAEPKQAAAQEEAPVMERVEEAGPQTQNQDEDFQIVDSESAPRPVFEDVEAAPIKVGEAAPEESSKPQDMGAQLANGIGGALQRGESRVTVSLTPESLGTVQVEITRSQDGALHVALSAENSQTRSLLEKHAMNLQTLLGSQRQETVQVEIQHQENQQQNNQPYDGHNGHNGQPQQEEQQRHHKNQSQNSQDFLHQLRLGLFSVEAEVS